MPASPRCPPFEAISRCCGGAASPSVLHHLERCARCARTAGDIRRLASAARAITPPPPSRAWVARTEEQLRSLRAPRQVPRRWLIPVAAALVAAASGLAAGRLLAPRDGPRAALVASAGARLRHVTVHPGSPGAPTVERIDLEEGSVSLRVRPLASGERLLVATSDGEVEVRGTEFEVTAAAGLLRRVDVRSGAVEVRRRGEAPVLLRAGSSWAAPREIAPAPEVVLRAAPEPAPRPPPPAASDAPRHLAAPVPPAPEDPVPVPEPPADPKVAPAEVAEDSFAAGWEALRSGNPGRAADRFARARDVAGTDALGEDARYWRIVALQRLGSERTAVHEAADFLRLFPRSARTGELALLVGADRLASGDRESARRYFAMALADASPEVRRRAREGMEAAGPAAR